MKSLRQLVVGIEGDSKAGEASDDGGLNDAYR